AVAQAALFNLQLFSIHFVNFLRLHDSFTRLLGARMARGCSGVTALNEATLEGHLVSHASQGLLGDVFRDAGDFEENRARLHTGSPEIDVRLTLTHSLFQRLLGDGLVGEHADEHFTFTLKEVTSRDTPCFNLTGREPADF